MSAVLPDVEVVEDLASIGFVAFTTTRAFGSLGTGTEEPVRQVMARWQTLSSRLEAIGVRRLATATQVHGREVMIHGGQWQGWLRIAAADGHACPAGSATAVAVTVADCVPVFLAHPSGAMALLHSGWRGTEARIVEAGLRALGAMGCPAGELVMHLGPAICGGCYEVSPDVRGRLTGQQVGRPTPVDLRALIAAHAQSCGVRTISMSRWCTRCDNGRFFSHRAGDAGRQISLMAPSPAAFA